MGGIIIFFTFMGLIGFLLGTRTEDFPLVRGLAAILIFGLLTAVFEILIYPYFQKFNFTVNMIINVIFYYFTFTLVIIFFGYATLVYKDNMSWQEAFKVDYYSVFPEGIGSHLLGLLFIVLFLSLVRFSNLMLGHGVWVKYISGKYHRPRSEDRIFMFLDLKSSTEIAEKLGHELYSNFLKDFFNKLDEAILETKGNLFQYVGDEIVMIWSFKHGFKNNNCIKFYFMVKSLIDNSQNEFLEKYGIIPEYKAGIHCGTVSITEIGSIRKSIAYHGDPINTAARVCAKCKELDEKLLVSENVYNGIINQMDYLFEDLGKFALKGKKNKLGLYSVKLA